jgi:uncharacterized membrane protein (UPF0127 family)
MHRFGRAFGVPGEVHSNEVRHNVYVLATLLAAALVSFPHGTAELRTPQRTVTVRVELASTTAQLRQGLQGRRSLARNAGMAFLFARDTRGPFWMKDTLIPLSIAFWDRRGRIVRILDMAPCTSDPCKLYDPKVTFRGALEVNRGAFGRWGVRPGAVVKIRR